MVAALLLGGALLATPAPVLVATDLTTGRVLLCRPLGADERLTLLFTHSMYGGDVAEEYVPAPDGRRLRRVALTTANAAAAEYYAYTASVVPTGGRFRVAVPVGDLDQVVVRVDRVGAHRLRLGETEIDLLAAAGDGHRVRLGVEPVGAARRLAGLGC